MLSSQCFENPPTASMSTACGAAGSVQEVGGLASYVTGTPHSKLAILLISDAFGYETPNLRKLADKVAAAGYFVVVPDFLYGDPADVSNPQFSPEAWLAAHNTEKGVEDAKQVIAALKSKGVSVVGAAGFCWGGMVVVKLASSDDIQAGVVLHPGPIKEDEIKGKFSSFKLYKKSLFTHNSQIGKYGSEVKVPIAILGAEIDRFSPPEQLKQFGEILSTKSDQFDSFVKIFPGVGHGWTMRYNVEDEKAVRSAEEAHEDMLNWFVKYVK